MKKNCRMLQRVIMESNLKGYYIDVIFAEFLESDYGIQINKSCKK